MSWAVRVVGAVLSVAVSAAAFPTGVSAQVPPLGDGAGAVSLSPGTIDVFVRGEDDRIYRKHFNGTYFEGFDGVGGLAASAPAVASRSQGTIDLFVRGQDDALWTRHFNGTSWGGWSTLGGLLSSAPAVISSARWHAGRLRRRNRPGALHPSLRRNPVERLDHRRRLVDGLAGRRVTRTRLPHGVRPRSGRGVVDPDVRRRMGRVDDARRHPHKRRGRHVERTRKD